MFTQSVSLISDTVFSDFRVEFSIDIPAHVTGFTRLGLTRRRQLRLKNIIMVANVLKAQEPTYPI